MDLNALSRWESIAEELNEIEPSSGKSPTISPVASKSSLSPPAGTTTTTPISSLSLASPISHHIKADHHHHHHGAHPSTVTSPLPKLTRRNYSTPTLGSIRETDDQSILDKDKESQIRPEEIIDGSLLLSSTENLPPPDPRTLLHVYDSFGDFARKSIDTSSSTSSLSPLVPLVISSAPTSPTSALAASYRWDKDKDKDKDKDGTIVRYPLRKAIHEEERPIITSTPLASLFIRRLVYRAARRFAKGLTIGFAGKSIFALLGLLIKSRLKWARFRKFPYLGSALLGEPLAYGLFLGSMIALYETTVTLLQRLYRHNIPIIIHSPHNHHSPGTTATTNGHPSSPSSSIISISSTTSLITVTAVSTAAICASLSLYLLPQSHRSSVTIFFVVRALEVCGKAIARHYRPYIPSSLLQYADVLTLCFASAEVCWAGIYHLSSVEPSYQSFLVHHSAKDTQSQLPLAALLHHAYNPSQVPFPKALMNMQSYRHQRQLPPLTMSTPYIQCHIWHPGKECIPFFIDFFSDAFRRAVPVYLPVYLIPLIVFKLKSLRARPFHSLYKLIVSITRSSTFLGCYASVGLSLMCLLRHIHHEPGMQLHAAIAGFLGGLSVLIEKKDRRIELCLYVLSQALRSFFNVCVDYHLITPYPSLLPAIFALSLAILLLAFTTQPQLLRPSYLSLMTYFFGTTHTTYSSLSSSSSSASSPHAIHISHTDKLINPILTNHHVNHPNHHSNNINNTNLIVSKK